MERALAILSSYSVEEPVLSLGELVEKTGLPKPTIFRILSTLESHRFVQSDGRPGRYSLGPKILVLGGVALSSVSLRQAAALHLDRLRDQTQATVFLGILLDDELVYVDKRESPGPIRIVSDVGWRRSPHFGMLGTVLMAYLGEDEVNRLLEKSPLAAHTQYSLTDRTAFERRLREIREAGVVMEQNEAHLGIWGVASPVRDNQGMVIAAVGSAGSTADWSEAKREEVVPLVKQCAADISESMGHHTGA